MSNYPRLFVGTNDVSHSLRGRGMRTWNACVLFTLRDSQNAHSEGCGSVRQGAAIDGKYTSALDSATRRRLVYTGPAAASPVALQLPRTAAAGNRVRYLLATCSTRGARVLSTISADDFVVR
jgi:hypothetical protein